VRSTDDLGSRTSTSWRDQGPLPWQADRPLTLEKAAEIIHACFPKVDTAGLRHLGYGWEFDAFLTADGWVFRFPRRIDTSELFERESAVVRLVEPALPSHVALPRVELRGPPTLGFPYTFVGHRFIDGVPADAIADTLLPTFAREIAEFLGALHSIPVDAGRAIGLREMDAAHEAGSREWRQAVLRYAQRLRGLDPLVDRALLSVAGDGVPPELFRVPLQFIHQDLSTDHVLVDPATGRLRGVIDWTDPMLADPARDFVFLVDWRGWPFVEEVLAHYPRAVDGEFRARLRWMARLLSIWRLDVARESGRDIDKALRAVRHVFTPHDVGTHSQPGVAR
jgi:aminoglycoside 2''-phosphotransferase